MIQFLGTERFLIFNILGCPRAYGGNNRQGLEVSIVLRNLCKKAPLFIAMTFSAVCFLLLAGGDAIAQHSGGSASSPFPSSRQTKMQKSTTPVIKRTSPSTNRYEKRLMALQKAQMKYEVNLTRWADKVERSDYKVRMSAIEKFNSAERARVKYLRDRLQKQLAVRAKRRAQLSRQQARQESAGTKDVKVHVLEQDRVKDTVPPISTKLPENTQSATVVTPRHIPQVVRPTTQPPSVVKVPDPSAEQDVEEDVQPKRRASLWSTLKKALW